MSALVNLLVKKIKQGVITLEDIGERGGLKDKVKKELEGANNG